MKGNALQTKKSGFGKFVTFFFPVYSFIPVFFWFVFNFSTFYGVRAINHGRVHYDLSIPLDGVIPYFAPAIIVYVLWYVQILVGFSLVARENRDVCYEVFTGEAVAKIITAVIFLALPTAMVRAVVPDGGFCNMITHWIYAADEPNNLFPSIHCLESWLIFRGLMKCKKVPRGFTVGFGVFSVLVFASVVLVKQHVFVDIPAGILVAEAGLFISRKFRLKRIYEKIYFALFGKGKKERQIEK